MFCLPKVKKRVREGGSVRPRRARAKGFRGSLMALKSTSTSAGHDRFRAAIVPREGEDAIKRFEVKRARFPQFPDEDKRMHLMVEREASVSLPEDCYQDRK